MKMLILCFILITNSWASTNLYDLEAKKLLKISTLRKNYLLPQELETQLLNSKHCFPLLENRIKSPLISPQSELLKSQREVFRITITCSPHSLKDTFNFDAQKVHLTNQASLGLLFLLVNAQMYYSPKEFSIFIKSLSNRNKSLFEKVYFIDNIDTDTQSAVIESEKHYIVLTSGTSTIRDWMGNLSFLKASTAEGNYHSGFHSAYKSVEKDILSILNQNPHKKVIFAGHSLGGAVTQIFMSKSLLGESDLERERLQAIITWGSPRVFAIDLAKKIEEEISAQSLPFLRIVNPKDLVSHLPFQSVGYLAVGESIDRVSDRSFRREQEKNKKSYHHFLGEGLNQNHMPPIYFSYHEDELNLVIHP